MKALFIPCIILLVACNPFNWGNTIEFHNESGTTITQVYFILDGTDYKIEDSIPTGDFSTLNLEADAKDHGAAIWFRFTQNGEVISLSADTLLCFNCDGTNVFTLNAKGIQYRFQN